LTPKAANRVWVNRAVSADTIFTWNIDTIVVLKMHFVENRYFSKEIIPHLLYEKLNFKNFEEQNKFNKKHECFKNIVIW
jgi:hypothetical protein